MPKRTLNDRALKALKPAPAGKTYDVMDSIVPGMGVRVSDKGQRTFVLVARFPGGHRQRQTSKINPTRRALGSYGVLTLEKARQKARDWPELIRRGIDPQEEEKRERLAEQRKRSNSFRAVAEDFVKLAVVGPDAENPKQRKGTETKRDIEKELVSRWADRPITEISAHDVMEIIDAAVARGAPYQAHNLFGHIRRLFNWAIARGVYGLDRSPCDRMKPRDLIGPKAARPCAVRHRIDGAVVRGRRSRLPVCPLFRMLALTGQRKSDVADARWSEVELPKKLWTIPAARHKSLAPHVVPLSDDVITVLKSLPTFGEGDHLFSTTFGLTPVNGFSKAKDALDEAMLAKLQDATDEPKTRRTVALEPFVIHDIRRTVRTGLSALPISSDVAELVIGHTRQGLRKVYDQYAYLDEKKRALDDRL
jgi:integrase